MTATVKGFRVGHVTDRDGLTGCSVVLCPPETIGAGEVRGGAPGTRETDLLRPGVLVQTVDGVVLTGGSAFGLASADGVVRYLEERGVGFDTGVARVPIVPAAVLFDLGVGSPAARPGPRDGYRACEASSTDVAEGSVGAGTGATVAKLYGPGRAVKGGVGMARLARDGVELGALVAVNALGEVIGEDGEVLAGALPAHDAAEGGSPTWPGPGEAAGRNTTLVVVATTARLSKERAYLLSLAGHEGISAAIRPAHTIWDGDAVFALASGEVDAPQAEIEEMAEQAVAEAIRRAVSLAEGVPGAPAAARASAEGSGEGT